MGKIELTVCAARKLHDGQLIGMPDPFVRLSVADKKYKTNVVPNNLSPEWNETFRFQIADEMSTQIRLEVWNKCTYSDDLMGYYTLSLGGLTKGIVKDEWYILEKSKTQAELKVRVLAVDFGARPKPEEQWMVTTDISRDPVQRAIEDGTWRPGQKTAPPPSGPPQAQNVQPAAVPPPQQPAVQYVQQPQPQVQPVQYAAAPPAPQVQYVQQPQPQVQHGQQPPPQGYYQGAPPPPQPGYYPPGPPPQQPGYYPPPQQPGYYPPGPPPPQPGYYPPPQQPGYYPPGPPQPNAQGYYAQPPPQGYAPQPGFRY